MPNEPLMVPLEYLDRVSFQDRKERAQMPTAFGLAGGIFDALMQVRLDHLLTKRFERLARGDNLHEHIRTVDVRFHHLLNPLDLSFDFAQADDEPSFSSPGR